MIGYSLPLINMIGSNTNISKQLYIWLYNQLYKHLSYPCTCQKRFTVEPARLYRCFCCWWCAPLVQPVQCWSMQGQPPNPLGFPTAQLPAIQKTVSPIHHGILDTIYTSMYIYLFVIMCLFIYVFICLDMYFYIYIYIYTDICRYRYVYM